MQELEREKRSLTAKGGAVGSHYQGAAEENWDW